MTANQQAEPVVRIAAVDKTFSRGDQVLTKALEAIDLDVARGEFVSLIGPSDCGKSTLLRIVGDLISPTRGASGMIESLVAKLIPFGTPN